MKPTSQSTQPRQKQKETGSYRFSTFHEEEITTGHGTFGSTAQSLDVLLDFGCERIGLVIDSGAQRGQTL